MSEKALQNKKNDVLYFWAGQKCSKWCYNNTVRTSYKGKRIIMKRPFNVWIEDDHLEWIKQFTNKSKSNVSSFIREAIEEKIEKEKNELRDG